MCLFVLIITLISSKRTSALWSCFARWVPWFQHFGHDSFHSGHFFFHGHEKKGRTKQNVSKHGTIRKNEQRQGKRKKESKKEKKKGRPNHIYYKGLQILWSDLALQKKWKQWKMKKGVMIVNCFLFLCVCMCMWMWVWMCVSVLFQNLVVVAPNIGHGVCTCMICICAVAKGSRKRVARKGMVFY